MAPMRLFIALAVAVVGAGATAFPVLSLALVLPELAAWTLAFTVAGITSALVAGWAGNLLGLDRSGAMLGKVVGINLIVGLLLAVLAATIGGTRGPLLILGALTLGTVAALTAENYRFTRRHPVEDLPGTIVYLVLAGVLVAGVIWAGPRLADLLEDPVPIALTTEEERWCREHMVQVLLTAQNLGIGSDAPAPERVAGSLTYDQQAVLEWVTRRPGEFTRSCRQAYGGS